MKDLFTGIYAILWSAMWWCLILTAGSSFEFIAYMLSLLIVFGFFFANHKRLRSLITPLAALLIGICIDGLLLATGYISYNSLWSAGAVPPPWIWCLWVLLGMGIVTYHSIFAKHLYQTLCLCATAPLCYIGAQTFGAVKFTSQLETTLSLVLVAYLFAGVILFSCTRYQVQQHA